LVRVSSKLRSENKGAWGKEKNSIKFCVDDESSEKEGGGEAKGCKQKRKERGRRKLAAEQNFAGRLDGDSFSQLETPRISEKGGKERL